MRRVRLLKTLVFSGVRKLNRFERRTGLLRRGLDDQSRSLDQHQLEAEIGNLVINLQSYWSNWCRAYYLSTALGVTSTGGTLVSSALGIATEHQAITVAITGSLTPPRAPPAIWPSYREPKWFAPDDLSRVLTDAQVSVAAPATSFLGAMRISLDHLRTMRNYYAHRSEELRGSALALGPTYLVGAPRKASEILLHVEPNRTVSVLERWVLDLKRLQAALCA